MPKAKFIDFGTFTQKLPKESLIYVPKFLAVASFSASQNSTEWSTAGMKPRHGKP